MVRARNILSRVFLGLLLICFWVFFLKAQKQFHPSPTSREKGLKVIEVFDGDTILLENGEKVRYLGIDAPELDEPFSFEATQLNRKLVWKKEIRLQFEERKRDIYNRLLAYVWVGDTWINAELIRQGLAVIRGPLSSEYRNQLIPLQEKAFQEGKGIWSQRLIGIPIQVLEVHYNARGDDRKDLNDEYISLLNQGNHPINITGWYISDESKNRYLFPQFVLNARQAVTIYTGTGKNTDQNLYWGRTRPVWNNDGDTIFLFNDEGKPVLIYSYSSPSYE